MLNGKRVTFYGKQGNNIITVSSHRMERILKKSYQGYLLPLRKEESATDKTTLALEPLLSKFSDIFVEQKGLLPRRSQDHCIPLFPRSTSTNVWSY